MPSPALRCSRSVSRPLAAALLAACAASPVCAQSQPGAEPSGIERAQDQTNTPATVIEPLESDWTIRLEPYVGYIAPAGDLRLPSATTRGGEIELTDLNLDSPNLVPTGRIQARRGKWTIGFSGLAFSADDQGSTQSASGQLGGVAIAPGDRLVSDLSYESFDLLVSYRFWQHNSETNASGRTRLSAGLDAVGGLRFHHADFDIRNSPAVAPAPGAVLNASADEFFAEPVLGLRLDLAFDERFGIEVESIAGGFGAGDRSSGSFSIDAGFAYRPVHWAGVKVGYRLLVFGLNDGEGAEEFDWAGSMAGLYFGGQFSF